MMDDMWHALGLGPGACVAFIGAGGKTTTIRALSEQAMELGLTAIVTTTTKIWPPAGMPLVLESEGKDLIDSTGVELQQASCVAVGSRLAESGKLLGLQPWEVCRLAGSGVADVVLCEADGAAGRSLKVHGPEEPVVPACATAVGVVAGLDAIGQPPGSKVIHRFHRFLAMAEFDAAEAITASMCARILMLAANRLDPAVPVTFILNKANDAVARHDAQRVADALAVRTPYPSVVVSPPQSSRRCGPRPLQSAASEPDTHVAP